MHIRTDILRETKTIRPRFYSTQADRALPSVGDYYQALISEGHPLEKKAVPPPILAWFKKAEI